MMEVPFPIISHGVHTSRKDSNCFSTFPWPSPRHLSQYLMIDSVESWREVQEHDNGGLPSTQYISVSTTEADSIPGVA